MVGGAIVIALGVAAIAWFHTLFGIIVLGVFGMAIVVATVLQARRGHRGWCLVRRGAWFGLAAPGSPVRVIVNA